MADLFFTTPSDNFTTSVGGAVASNDNIYVNRGDQQYNAGLALGAVDAARLEFGAECGSDFVQPLVIVVDQSGAGKILCQSRSRRLQLAAGSATAIHNFLLVDMARGGQVWHTSARSKQSVVRAGTYLVYDSVDLDKLRVAGGSATILPSSANPTVDEVVVSGGECTLQRDVTDALVQGAGVLTIDDPSVTPSTLTLRGGVCRLRSVGATIGTLTLHAGTLDLSGLSRPVSITTTTLYAAARIVMPKNPALVAWGSVALPDEVDPRTGV